MSPTLQALGIDRLSVAERIALVQEIWDSIAAEAEQAPLTEAQGKEVDRRLAVHREAAGGHPLGAGRGRGPGPAPPMSLPHLRRKPSCLPNAVPCFTTSVPKGKQALHLPRFCALR